jgi:hypothetical protein
MTGASAHSEMPMRTWQERARCFEDQILAWFRRSSQVSKSLSAHANAPPCARCAARFASSSKRRVDDLDRHLGMIATCALIHSAPILTTDTDFTMMRNAGVALQLVAR